MRTQPLDKSLDALMDGQSDLRLVMGEERLADAVRDSVRTVLFKESNAKEMAPPRLAPPADSLLRLLTYAYAAGIAGSLNIEHGCRHDSTLSRLCANHFPDFDALRSFRRRHRSLIESCLAKVLERAETDRCVIHRRPAQTHQTYLETPMPRWSLEVQPTRIDGEARRRVRHAIQEDSMTLDV